MLVEMATRPSHKPGKPRAKGCMSVDANVFTWNLYCQGIQVYSSSTRSSPEGVSGGVNLCSVCGLVATGKTRSCELPGNVVRPIMVP